MIVVDTSVLIDFLRGRETSAAVAFERLERDGVPFAITSVTAQELLQGARDEKEWRLLLEYVETQRRLEPRDAWAAHVGAARIFFDCRRAGRTVRSLVDCWIAQLVLDADGVLLHDDDDFETIGRVRPLRTARS